MQITIIGAGIAGLSSYLFLFKHLQESQTGPHKIKIYETYQVQPPKHASSDTSGDTQHPQKDITSYKTIGAAIGIGKNGLSVLNRIDDGEALKQIKQRGNCISTWKMGTARGWKLVDAVVASSPGEEGSKDGAVQPTVMISRQAVWEVLRDKVLEIDSDAIVEGKVVEVGQLQNGRGKVLIKLNDGSERVADLVIGADGLRSVVRKTMFEGIKDVESQRWWQRVFGREPRIKDYVTPEFVGLTGIGGTLPSDVLKQAGFEHGAMAITFGPNGFFGHGYISPPDDSDAIDMLSSAKKTTPLAAWWSTFSSETPYPFRRQDNDNKDPQTTKTHIDEEATLQNLRARHGSWKDPVIQAIVNYICDNDNLTVHTYPTYTTPELPTWHKNKLVLIGDAAHALQPSSGQGACQALEDSEALALLLSHYLNDNDTDQDEAIDHALTKFDELRRPRLAKIYEQSSKFGKMKTDMNVVQEFLMYFFIWLAHKMGGFQKYNDELFEYDLPAEVERMVKG